MRAFPALIATTLLACVTLLTETRAADPPFGTRGFPLSWYGYNLDEYAGGYFGGGRYTRYYAYGRSSGVSIADFPGPVPTAPYPWFGPGKYMPTPRATAPLHIQHPAPCNIVVWVPEQAEVWVDQTLTNSTGPGRVFVSPPLDPVLRHTYEIRARWTGADGKEIDQTQVIGVYAGDRTVVRFPAE
jgi:uncharacterized protein (TIGR03000 family)